MYIYRDNEPWTNINDTYNLTYQANYFNLCGN